MITRTDTGAEALRLTLDSGPAATRTSVGAAARGNTLLVAAAPHMGVHALGAALKAGKVI